MAKRFLTPIGIVNLASDPATGSEGEIYYNSTDDILKIYVSGSWTPIEGGGGAAINVSASAPIAPEEGDAWFDNTDGKFYVYDGSFWVETGQTDAVFSSYNRWTKVISASTVNITGLDDNGTNLEYTPGLEQVYINGVFIDESSYTATSGSAIVLDEAVFSTDLVEVLWLENLVVADTYSKAESDAKYLSSSTQFLNYWAEDNDGNFLPELDNLYSIGASAYRVKDLYLGASSLYIQSYSNPSQNIQISMGEGDKLKINNDELVTLSTASSTFLTIANASATYATQENLNNIDLTTTIQTASAAAVNFLVDGAPGALDTLNELASALNDDSNFATTVTNSLSEKLNISTASTTYLTITAASAIYEPNIPYVSASPSTPSPGTLWIDSTNSAAPALKVYNGSTWIAVSGAASESGFNEFFLMGAG
jgi:hypothetical protein